MTVDEFKKLKPEYAHFEGDNLYDAMTLYMLEQQRASEIIKVAMPVWKTHTLRWLFYRKVSNLLISNPKYQRWTASRRCSKCKKGVSVWMAFSCTDKNGRYNPKSLCPHCGKDFIFEPNTNLSHRLYNTYKSIIRGFWLIFDRLHLIRSSIHGRYDMFGDEARYVAHWTYDKNWNQKKPALKKRKWWEYILIEKPRHNFFK